MKRPRFLQITLGPPSPCSLPSQAQYLSFPSLAQIRQAPRAQSLTRVAGRPGQGSLAKKHMLSAGLSRKQMAFQHLGYPQPAAQPRAPGCLHLHGTRPSPAILAVCTESHGTCPACAAHGHLEATAHLCKFHLETRAGLCEEAPESVHAHSNRFPVKGVVSRSPCCPPRASLSLLMGWRRALAAPGSEEYRGRWAEGSRLCLSPSPWIQGRRAGGRASNPLPAFPSSHWAL